MKRVVLGVSMVVIFLVGVTGCNMLDKVKSDFNESKIIVDNNIDEPMVVIESSDEVTTVTEETQLVTLYFMDPINDKLMAEERTIPKVTGIARATMEELIRGPVGSELNCALPVTTKLLDINVREDGLAIVDFSEDLINDLPVSAEAEELAVYSIVNTLTQFPTVQEVEMRIEGRKVDTLLGYVNLDENLKRNASLLK
ncbi:MAG: GerMN domain-containing protein [Clostridia bacterium]|nr:GerMN domain-containing protein [Clostridia bacterium]MDD4048716.1 GerMN domain-containing protein [Clostridia bacterium]